MIKTPSSKHVVNYAKAFGCTILVSLSICLLVENPLVGFVVPFAVMSALVIAWYEFYFKHANRISEDELLKLVESEGESLAKVAELTEILDAYETQLDDQVVVLPCHCGKDMFEGILVPNAENVCVCPHCHTQYKVMVSYDSIQSGDTQDTSKIAKALEKLEESA